MKAQEAHWRVFFLIFIETIRGRGREEGVKNLPYLHRRNIKRKNCIEVGNENEFRNTKYWEKLLGIGKVIITDGLASSGTQHNYKKFKTRVLLHTDLKN